MTCYHSASEDSRGLLIRFSDTIVNEVLASMLRFPASMPSLTQASMLSATPTRQPSVTQVSMASVEPASRLSARPDML